MMDLPDFTEFNPFNELREKMAATELGYFELFDPKYHLTGFERSEIATEGMVVVRSSIQRLIDFTIVYKNSRIIVLDGGKIHTSRCSAFPEGQELLIATVANPDKGFVICRECLQTLRFDGFDNTKARRESYSEQVVDRFSLNRFWRQFKLYPVSEKKDLRIMLDER